MNNVVIAEAVVITVAENSVAVNVVDVAALTADLSKTLMVLSNSWKK